MISALNMRVQRGAVSPKAEASAKAPQFGATPAIPAPSIRFEGFHLPTWGTQPSASAKQTHTIRPELISRQLHDGIAAATSTLLKLTSLDQKEAAWPNGMPKQANHALIEDELYTAAQHNRQTFGQVLSNLQMVTSKLSTKFHGNPSAIADTLPEGFEAAPSVRAFAEKLVMSLTNAEGHCVNGLTGPQNITQATMAMVRGLEKQNLGDQEKLFGHLVKMMARLEGAKDGAIDYTI